MSDIPSLKALQALEAAARLGSFASAAQELSVSPAAVSQLIRSLEDQIGHRLFYRINRGITLTEAGLEALPRLSAAFDEIRAVSRRLSGSGSRARLTISAPSSIASGWLAFCIAEFAAQCRDADISLREDVDPVDFDRQRIDLRFSYGRFHYQTHTTDEIVTDSVIPVCAPGFLEQYGPFDTPQAIAKARLIHTDWGPAAATFPVWRDWYEKHGIEQEGQHARGMVASSSAMAVNLAISGLGITLCQSLLASRHLAEGKLVQITGTSLLQNQPYCLTIPRRSANRPIVNSLREWLVQRCISTVSKFTV